MNIQTALAKVIAKENLSQDEAFAVMGEIMSGQALPEMLAGFLAALRVKGETVPEVAGFAKQMRAHASNIHPHVANMVDTCGTGGDGKHTFNISTVSALVAAGAGVPIAKHGNRAASSTCGSADLLAALGVDIELPPERVETCIETVGMGFMFAPRFHAAMKYAMPVRKALGVRTVFNILGPLTNPAGATRQVLGVFSKELVPFMAEVLQALGSEEALVVHGEDGLDEISISSPTTAVHLKHSSLTPLTLTPEGVGLSRHPLTDIQSGGLPENVAWTRALLDGKKQGGIQDAVLLNAGAAIMVGGLAKDLSEGVAKARAAIETGSARKKLADFVAYTITAQGVQQP